MSSYTSFRPNASSVALGTTTLTGRLTGLKPTPYKSTTWLTTCECSTKHKMTERITFEVFLIYSRSIIHNTRKAATFHVCRFFLMYLINKDETEHTGQVRDNYTYV